MVRKITAERQTKLKYLRLMFLHSMKSTTAAFFRSSATVSLIGCCALKMNGYYEALIALVKSSFKWKRRNFKFTKFSRWTYVALLVLIIKSIWVKYGDFLINENSVQSNIRVTLAERRCLRVFIDALLPETWPSTLPHLKENYHICELLMSPWPWT